MKALVTGGRGFIGKYLVNSLLQSGHEVVVLSRTSPPTDHPSLKYITCDLTQLTIASLNQILPQDIDVLFNCAGEITDEQKMYDMHVTGTQKLLDWYIDTFKNQKTPKRWIQLSSVGAYGPPSHPTQDRIVTEKTPENPQCVYEKTKTLSDHLIINQLEAKNMDFCILRPSNVIG